MNKRTFGFTLGLGLIISVLVACGAASNTASSVETSKTGTQASTPTTASAPKTFKIGQTVNVGGIWDITVNSAKTNPGTQYSTPTKGTFFLVDVTVKNISGQAQPISSIIDFKLQDASGIAYTESYVDSSIPNPPDGTVQAGALSRGTFSYDVPTKTTFTLSFTPSITSTDATIWNLSD